MRRALQTFDSRSIPSASDCRVFGAGRLLLDDEEVTSDARCLALQRSFRPFAQLPLGRCCSFPTTSSAASRLSDLLLFNRYCPENQKEIALSSVNHHCSLLLPATPRSRGRKFWSLLFTAIWESVSFFTIFRALALGAPNRSTNLYYCFENCCTMAALLDPFEQPFLFACLPKHHHSNLKARHLKYKTAFLYCRWPTARRCHSAMSSFAACRAGAAKGASGRRGY